MVRMQQEGQGRKNTAFSRHFPRPRGSLTAGAAVGGADCTEHMKIIKQERLEISSRKLEIPREHFMQRWAQ